MRIRNFLLVHSSRSVRAMVKKLMLAELDDIEIIESDAGADAIQQLSMKPFELLISECQLADMHVTELKKWVGTQSLNIDIRFLVISDNEAEGEADKLVQAGMALTRAPIVAQDLIDMINRLCNPRKWRAAERFHIPKSKAVLSVWGMEAAARLINISLGGVLIEVSGDRSELLLQNNPKLTLRFKSPADYHSIRNLPCKLIRLDIIEWDANHKPIAMRGAYIFLELDPKSQMELEQVIMIAQEKEQYAAEELADDTPSGNFPLN